MRRRFQLVTFWHPAEWTLHGPVRFIGHYRHVYRWAIGFGPFELRRWVDPLSDKDGPDA